MARQQMWMVVGFCALAVGCEMAAESVEIGVSRIETADGGEASLGLSLWFDNGLVRRHDGSPDTVTIYGDAPRYIHELDITASVASDTDRGIAPITEEGDLAGLDWEGIEHVETDWRPNLEGTGYTRQRFYRGAAWMERSSKFKLVPVDAAGNAVGEPITALTGADDHATPGDDGFVRRFVARQLTYDCPDIGDCSGATGYEAQAFVQFRNELHPDRRARHIPREAEALVLVWSEDPARREVPIERADLDDTPWTYGFQVRPEVVTQPANGQFFTPGESFDVQVTFTDGAGRRLHPEGSLPTYHEFMTGQVESGLRYYDGLRQLLSLYYVFKHREGLIMWSFAGPTDRLKVSSTVVPVTDFIVMPQATKASVEDDGYSAGAILNPSMAQTLMPDLPVSDRVTFTLPADALPGTYVVTVKARRDWGGEALNRAGTVEMQVGTDVPTEFEPKTGNCQSCHDGPTRLGNLLHGVDDRRACFSCHAEMEFEPDNRLDYRVHFVHSRSRRMPADPEQCSLCHLDDPEGPAWGFPGFTLGY